jgi:hypothetical protein
MARAGWAETRDKAQRVGVDYFRDDLIIKSGARTVSLKGILDTGQDADAGAKSPPGTFPVIARLSCWKSELGWKPAVDEAIRITETANPTEEQFYLVASVASSGELLTIELRAHSNHGSPFHR